jgi:CRP-like cAMP-binding protein
MPLSSPNELANLLKGVPLFSGLDGSSLERVASAAHERALEGDEYFFHEGEPASHLHVLHTGEVRIFQLTPEGNQVLLRFIHPWNVFGGVAAFGQNEYPASAQAIGDSSAWVWSGAVMRELMQELPQLALNALAHTAETIQQLQERVRELQTEKVERRVARALLRLARQRGKRTAEGVLIDLPLSRQDLAEMTGTNLYSVSRIVSAWEKQGWVMAGRERVVLRVPHKLVAFAEDLPPPQAEGDS